MTETMSESTKKPADLIRLSYEIAMSIGLTLDLNKMLKVALTSYLKNLDCVAGAIFQQRKKGRKQIVYHAIYTVPRNIKDNPDYQQIIKQLSRSFDYDELDKFRKKLPLIGSSQAQISYHLLDLPGFGLLLLIKEEKELDTQIVKAISSLNAKLAVACNACMQNKELKKAHKKEIDINRRLRQKTVALEQSQYALSESEKKYRTIFENIQDIFFQINLSGKLLEISPSIYRFTDKTREDLMGTAIQFIYQDPADHARLLAVLQEKEEVEDFEVQLKDSHGRKIFTSVNAHLVFDQDRLPVAIEGLMRDISVRRRAEQALRESDRMKSDFVSSVSHELRTPLASILGFSSTILRDKNMAENIKEEFINIIYQESQRLSKLIEDILNISRLESGRVTYRLHRIDFVPVISEIIEVHRLQAEEKGILFKDSLQEGSTQIFADSNAMKQVLTNLVGNAIKFTLEKGQIDIRLFSENNSVIFEISDTGIGIPESEQKNIFNKFYRVYRPGLEITGTGLGLSIVKEILDAHQAQIEVESQENKGTTFRLIFPEPQQEVNDE
jgi:PAS domain S-box-containing protein